MPARLDYAATEYEAQARRRAGRRSRFRLRGDRRLPGGVREGRRVPRQASCGRRLATPDYTPYVAQIADCDGVCQGFAGSNPLRFMKAYATAGMKYPVVTGEAGRRRCPAQELRLTRRSAWSSRCPYSLDLESEANTRFIDGDGAEFQRHSRFLFRRHLRQLPGGRSRPQGDWRRSSPTGKSSWRRSGRSA